MRSAEERFWPKVNQAGADECWIWNAGKGSHGYGQFWDGSNQILAHRFAYQSLVGPIPSGLSLDHLCRTPACVNPAHLEPVTHRENCRRGNQGAALAARTHCVNGHEYDEANTYIRPSGHRDCKACILLRGRKRRMKARSNA